jgi:ribonuclease E
MTPAEPISEAEAPAEKPKRTRRKKVAETAESTPLDAAPVAAIAAEDGAEEKPKRKPRTRKPKTEVSQSAPESEAAEPEPAVIEAAPAEEAPKPRRAKKELPAEGIVVSSSAPKADAEGDEGEQPKKKVGWWQRRLGLG